MKRAAELLSYKSGLAYWADLLEHYASLQTFTPRLHPSAVPASSYLGWCGAWCEQGSALGGTKGLG